MTPRPNSQTRLAATRSACRPRWPRFGWLIGLALGLIPLLLAAPSPVAAQSGFDEYQVKAAFLYHFAQFVEWPAGSFRDSREPLNVCVVGADPSDGLLEATIKEKSVSERPLRVRFARSPETLQECRLVFVPANERKRWQKTKPSLDLTAVLTVGEGADFVLEGGIIGLTVEESRIRFEINLEAAERARLKISSKLLALAKVVHYGSPAQGGKP